MWLVTARLPLEEHKGDASPESLLIYINSCVLQKQIQSLNKMCSNLLEKISKEERESESGGKEGWLAEQRRSCTRSLE